MTTRTADLLAAEHAWIAELDRQVIGLLQQRLEAVAELDTPRRATGRPTVDVSRENGILHRYHTAFGRRGAAIAMLVMGLGRHRAGAAQRVCATSAAGKLSDHG